MEELTKICFYQGGHGSTIRIAVENKKWLLLFKKMIVGLKNNEFNEFEITSISNLECIDLNSIKLIRTEHAKRKKLTIHDSHFNWLQDKEELITLIGLIDGLLDNDMPSHQYMTRESDGILIILSYKE